MNNDMLHAIIKDTRQIDDLQSMLVSICERLHAALPAEVLLLARQADDDDHFEPVAVAGAMDHRTRYAMNYLDADYSGTSFAQDDAWVQAITDTAALVAIGALDDDDKTLLDLTADVLAPFIMLDDRTMAIASLAATMSLELKNITSNVLSASEQLVDDDQKLSAIQQIKDGAAYAHRAADTLRDVLLIKVDRVDRSQDAVSLTSILSPVDALREDYAEKGVSLTVDAPDDLPAVRGGEGHYRQVVRALLENALRYTPPGGSVTVTAAASGDVVAITVADTGAGIPVDEAEHVFKMFHPGKASIAHDERGLGLSLYIAKQVITAEGGDITFESEPGRGTTFTLSLPVHS